MNLDDYDGLTEEEAIKVAENILEVCKIEDELENEKQELSKESSPSEENELQEEFKNLLIKYKENYKKALSLGSSQSIKEVYDAAGIRFDFSGETIKELMLFVEKELELLEQL